MLEKFFTYTWNYSLIFFRRISRGYILFLYKYSNYIFLTSNYPKKFTNTYLKKCGYFTKYLEKFSTELHTKHNHTKYGAGSASLLIQTTGKFFKNSSRTSLFFMTLLIFNQACCYFWYNVFFVITAIAFQTKINLNQSINLVVNQNNGGFWRYTFYNSLLKKKNLLENILIQK